ncbi:hypothetical protein GCM10010964_29880 [Caldovatus sediminis]|uniref:Uncharacterized protein n=1 Tax=Caldovatus sediminis TaxID=2041189 RepID=A0A8J2ZDE2_9PROT|nr:hypothetical protein [Caldovatus sediminis]GGG40307.1 hypothetical protein GCM10010964_29880 [Caldovatus sediminis]
MEADSRLQRILERVELVGGIGAPKFGRMCVMSLAAHLAGEPHTDCPASVSPVIRGFAVPINDQMPGPVRQRLKPFAPRLIGTDDGLDAVRTDLLRAALAERLVPRAAARHGTPPDARRPAGAPVHARSWLAGGDLRWRIGRLLEQIRAESDLRPGSDVHAASLAGYLIGLCARAAPDPREAEWYWTEGLGLLDRMCDLGASRRPAGGGVRADRLARLASALPARGRGSVGLRMPAAGPLAARFPGHPVGLGRAFGRS